MASMRCSFQGCAENALLFEVNLQSASRLWCGLPRIDTHHCALLDHDGSTSLRIPRRGLQSLTEYAPVETQDQDLFDHWDEMVVPMRILDSLSIQNVGFIKIDVGGHKLPVLRGGEQTIMLDRPILFIKVSGVNAGELE